LLNYASIQTYTHYATIDHTGIYPVNKQIMESDKNKNISYIDIDGLPLQLSIFEPDEIVRPDYNIGKHAGFIFASPYSKNLDKPRSHEWVVKPAENEEATASITISPQYGMKRPTTTTLRVYLALLQIWQASGQPEDGVIEFSARQLATIAGWRWGGAKMAKRISDQVRILQATGITWIWGYKQASGDLKRVVSDISILSSAEYSERKTLLKKEKFSPVQRVRLNPDLVDNMIAGHVRPINYKVFTSISNDTALNLYARLDLYLSKKTMWQRRSIGLFRDELGMDASRYDQRFARKAKLKEFVKQLDGVELCTGVLKLTIEVTSDGEDYKLVARKITNNKARRLSRVKRTVSTEDAVFTFGVVMDVLTKHPQGGKPNGDFIRYLCELYPIDIIHEALSIAKNDYHGKVKHTLTQVFIFELKQRVQKSKKYTWYNDVPKEDSKLGDKT
jgi:hypothetical protein